MQVRFCSRSPLRRTAHKPQTRARIPATQLGTPGYLHPAWEASSQPSFATLNLPGGPVSCSAYEGRREGGAPAWLPGRDAASALRPRLPPCLCGYKLSSGPAWRGPWSPCPGLPSPPPPARACETGLPRWASRGALADFMASCFCDKRSGSRWRICPLGGRETRVNLHNFKCERNRETREPNFRPPNSPLPQNL